MAYDVHTRGQRMLLALDETSGADVSHVWSQDHGVWLTMLIALAAFTCLTMVLGLCACWSGDKEVEGDVEGGQTKRKSSRKSSGNSERNGIDMKESSPASTVAENGGNNTNRNSAMSGHSRQASAGSAHNMRPTSLRELPDPPVAPAHHARNLSAPGIIECDHETGVAGPEAVREGGEGDFTHHHYQEPHPRTAASGNSTAGAAGRETAVGGKPNQRHDSTSSNDGYDHFGVKPNAKPADYDTLGDLQGSNAKQEEASPSLGQEVDVGSHCPHYSQLGDRTYAVVQDVKKQELYDPYSHVKDSDDAGSHTDSNIYSPMKDEDPYNHIGESDGAVSTTMIQRIRQQQQQPAGSDLDDPYATLQDEDTGEVTGGSLGNTQGTPQHPSGSPPHPRTPQHAPDDEYAVVNKVRPSMNLDPSGVGGDSGGDSGGTIQPYSVGPPEPPRLYHLYGEGGGEDGPAASEHDYSDSATEEKEHKYFKVTARESLASMSARNALNTYEMVPDLPENTYATVEGGSGDGVMLRGPGSQPKAGENRLSQTSDTYAEIAISGGGLTSTAHSTTTPSTPISTPSSSAHPNPSGGAPVPPSLDSLHMMTKSQTSSEGDRLSERHLASPEDSALAWADEEAGGSAGSSEDGYSTLKRSEVPAAGSPGGREVTLRSSGGQNHGGSGGGGENVKLVSNYQTVKDCLSDSEVMEELENDPDYESVDETRAKVAALKARSKVSSDSREPKVKVVQVYPPNGPPVSENGGGGARTPQHRQTPSKKKRGGHQSRPDHDYEELDMSPPTSPTSSTTPTSAPFGNSASSPVTSPSRSNKTGQREEAEEDMSQLRDRLLQSHLYEELPAMRERNYEVIQESPGAAGKGKRDSADAKRKNSAADKSRTDGARKSGGRGDDKRKSGSATTSFTRL